MLLLCFFLTRLNNLLDGELALLVSALINENTLKLI